MNLAFEDSLSLANAIISASQQADPTSALDKQVANFEQDMFKRATETQQLTYDMMTLMYHTPGAPRQSIERYILRAVEGELGYWLTWIATPVVYAYFFVFKLIW